jgi:hypothetical protein
MSICPPRCAQVLNRRNWCEVDEMPHSFTAPAEKCGALLFMLRIEDATQPIPGMRLSRYIVEVPRFISLQQQQGPQQWG